MVVLQDKVPAVVERLRKSVSISIPISIIVPVLNDAQALLTLSRGLIKLQRKGHQVIVIDGGSCDHTIEVASSFSDCVLQSSKGRALQMNVGADVAEHPLLWFLHADTVLPEDADQHILKSYRCSDYHHFWGRFDVRMSNPRFIFRTIAFFMNLRSRVTSVATGDQGLFVTRDLFAQVGKFQSIPLMEDIAISKKLRQFSRPVCIKYELQVSSRRWEQHGALKTILLMWGLRLAYSYGVSPKKLYKVYYS